MRSQGEIVPASDHPTNAPIEREDRIQSARNYLDKRLSENTKRAHEQGKVAWERFCAERGESAYPVDPVTIVEYIQHLDESGDKAYKTIECRITWLRGALKAEGAPFTPEAALAASLALESARKAIATRPAVKTKGSGKAPAVTVDELRAMSAACPNTLRGIRDRALALLGFAIGARRSELASLHVDDIAEVAAGLEVHVRWSKTGKERHPKVPYGQHLGTCPVRAWKAWLAAADITEGPAFRRIDRHGNLGPSITPDGVGDAIASLAARAGLGERTAHGLRSGMATEGRRAKHDAIAIARQGGWTKHSRDMLGYMQIIDEWEDNPLYGIGL